MGATSNGITQARFRPGLISNEHDWAVDTTQIKKDGATFVTLSEITTYRFMELSTGKQQVAVLDLFTADGKKTIQCNLGRRHEQRHEFLRFVIGVLSQLEQSNPAIRAKPPSAVAKWAQFLVGLALVGVAIFFLASALLGDENTRILFFVFAGFAAVAGTPWLIGPLPWTDTGAATPRQTIEFIEAASLPS